MIQDLLPALDVFGSAPSETQTALLSEIYAPDWLHEMS